MSWSKITQAAYGRKLDWITAEFRKAGIEYRQIEVKGKAAPVMEVKDEDWRRALKIVDLVDDMDNDDPRLTP